MDRRSGLKKAHFSSVPTRMSLFTCKKVCFSDREKFSEPYRLQPCLKIGKTQHNALYESRCGVGTKFYRVFVVIPTIYIEIKYLWGWLWLAQRSVFYVFFHRLWVYNYFYKFGLI